MRTLAFLPRTVARLALGLALLVVGLAAPVLAFAQACTGDPRPQIFLRNPITTVHNPSGLTRAFASTLSYTFHTELAAALGGRVNVVWEEQWVNTAEAARTQMLLGADTVGNSILNNEVLPQAATDWLMLIQLRPDVDGIRRQMVMTLFDTRRHRVERQRSAALPRDNAAVPAVLVAEARAFAQGLDCSMRLARGAPVQPQVRIAVEPQPPRGQTGDSLTVRATLVDLANGAAPVPNKRLTVTYLTPQGERISRWATTDASGVATDHFVLGDAHPRAGLIEAGFRDLRGIERKSQQINYYVRPAGGQLALTTGKAQLVPGGADTVTAALGLNATAVASASVTVDASAGAVGSAGAGGSTRVITSTAGLAAVPYVAPATPSLVDLRALATLPAGGGTAAASVSVVIDPGVVMSLAAGGDTVIFGAASLRVDLEREQRAVAGATVEFSVVGGGTLSASSATTDSVGRAEIAFAAPSRAGASTITARVTLDGQTYSRSVTVRYTDPIDAITREIADVKEAMWLDPSDATLTRLATLRSLLQGRGEGGRAESLLGDPLVRGPLTCVHQRAHDECAAGARTRAEPTLGRIKSIADGSTVLDDLFSRARDSLRVCPYTPFVNGSVYVSDATISDIVFTHTVGLFFGISSWGPDDRPANFYFDARDETGTINRYVRGTVPVAGAGASYSATISDGDLFNLWGNRFWMLAYQRNATAPTVSITINGTQVGGIFNLYRGEYDGVEKTAFVAFNTTVALPPAPDAAMCRHASLPPAGGS